MSVRITGPYVDVKGSQAHPHAVTVYSPGVGVRVERFREREQAETFATLAREAHASAD
jgi:hypothetical protein